MPIKHAMWKVSSLPVLLPTSALPNEQQLEDMIVASPEILSSEWMLIGRQEQTGMGGRIDLLAMAPDGSLVLIELKRNKTPRDIVAQAIDYASWVEQLTADRVSQIYQRFSKSGNLDEAFRERFGTELDEETLNASHQIIVVAAELDDSTERIINYLNARDVAINVLLFQVFQHGPDQFLSRVWLIDPGETQANVVVATNGVGEKKEPWNGEYYVSFGHRPWNDARTYGFISAGGGGWYSQTLKLLNPGDRVWVKIPGVGYVGVGRVTGRVVSVNEFEVKTPAGERPAMDALSNSEALRRNADDPDKAEYFVAVDWLDTVPESQAVKEVGLFGNQNTVCQPTAAKWRHTVERLKTSFPEWDSQPANDPESLRAEQ